MTPVRLRARSRAEGEEAPKRASSPEVGRDWPEISRIRVVLPAPFRPTRPRICPFSTDRLARIQGQGPAYRRGQLPGPQDQFRHSVHLSF